MKRGIKLSIIFGLLPFCKLLGFNDSLGNGKLNFPIKKSLEPISTNSNGYAVKVMPIASFDIETGSNAIPLSMVSKFAFGGYISPESMNNYQSMLSSSNRMGAIQEYRLTLYPIIGNEINKSISLKTVELLIQDVFGANFTQDGFRLFFQGNTNYLGQTLNADNNDIEAWRNRFVRFVFNAKSKFFGFALIPSIQFGQCLSYTRISTKDIKLTSDQLGDKVDFSGSGYFASTGYSFGGNGYGLQGGLDLTKTILQTNGMLTNIELKLQNFGFYSFSDVSVTSKNAIWNANGEGLTPEDYQNSQQLNLTAVKINASDLRFGSWFTRQKDSIVSKLNLVDSKRSGMIMSPFTIYAGIDFRNRNNFYAKLYNQLISLKYINLIGYLPRLNYIATFKGEYITKKNNKTLPFFYQVGASVGGFDDIDINCGLSFNSFNFKGKPLVWSINLIGIESFVNPSKWHGGGIGMHLGYKIF
jgi:hypothetical protein